MPRRCSGCACLDPVDADHTATWKGTAVHEVLEQWLAAGRLRPRTLCCPRAADLVAGDAIHPMLRALWQPRLIEAIDWIAERGAQPTALPGARPLAAEIEGNTTLAGVTLKGKADRIDRLADGSLGDRRLQDRQGPGAQSRRGRFRAPARPARPDRAGWGIRGHRRRAGRARILVAGQGQGQVRQGFESRRQARAPRPSSTMPNGISPPRPRDG